MKKNVEQKVHTCCNIENLIPSGDVKNASLFINVFPLLRRYIRSYLTNDNNLCM